MGLTMMMVFLQIVVWAKPTKIIIIFLRQLMFLHAVVSHIYYACAFNKIGSYETISSNKYESLLYIALTDLTPL